MPHKYESMVCDHVLCKHIFINPIFTLLDLNDKSTPHLVRQLQVHNSVSAPAMLKLSEELVTDDSLASVTFYITKYPHGQNSQNSDDCPQGHEAKLHENEATVARG